MALKSVSGKELESVVKSNGIVVVDVYATWCGPCKMIAPILEALSDRMDDVKFVKVNSELLDNKAFLLEMKVTNIPDILFFKDGVQMDRQIGFVPKEILENKIMSLKNN